MISFCPHNNHVIVVVQSLSQAQLFVTPWNTTRQASLSFIISWSLLKIMSMKEDAMQISRPLTPRLLLPSIFPSIRVFSNESALPIRWQKYWSFSFSISSSNEYSGLIFFFLELTASNSLQSKRLSRVFSNTVVQKHQFFSAQPSLWSRSYMHT